MDVVKHRVESIVVYSGNFISTSVSSVDSNEAVHDLFQDVQIVLKEIKEKQRIR